MLTKRLHKGHPQPVELLPTPPEPERAAVNAERRRYAKLMGESAIAFKALYDKVYTDKLTGAGNRRLLDEQVPDMLELAKQHNIPVALVFADVKGQKRTNDSEGYDAGDEVIKGAGAALKDILRDDDLVIRPGGDEFVAILFGYQPKEPEEGKTPQTQQELDIETTARIKNNFSTTIHEHGIPEDLHVGIDVGIVTMGPDDTLASMLTSGAALMSVAKREGYADLAAQGIDFPDSRV